MLNPREYYRLTFADLKDVLKDDGICYLFLILVAYAFTILFIAPFYCISYLFHSFNEWSKTWVR